jgi:hypothetical protein
VPHRPVFFIPRRKAHRPVSGGDRPSIKLEAGRWKDSA